MAGMAAVRTAAVFLLALAPVIRAQQNPKSIVAIQVTDTTGAVIPGAQIEVDPSPSQPGPTVKTDSEGQAVIDLSAGTHTLSIAAPGFKKWVLGLDVRGAPSQKVAVQLQIADIGGPTLVEQLPDLSVSLGVPEPVFIEPRPLLILEPLPTRPAGKHR